MKRILFLPILITVLFAISSCSSDKELTNWDVETMTMTDGEDVNIANTMILSTSYSPRFKETICTLSKSHGFKWIDTYYVWRDDKLYESKYSPYKYENEEDSVTNKIERTKNIFWQKKMISVDKEPSYSVINLGNDRIKLVYIDGSVAYTFKKADNVIRL